ncbi:MAG: pilus assembly protein [Acidocella sp.]|nr:pilus assembly protein [Acidocella sp.]
MPRGKWCRWQARRFPANRRGNVSLMFALSFVAILACVGAAINMAQLAQARAVLQRAVDNAALSGAAAYSQNAPSFAVLATNIATHTYCNTMQALSGDAKIVSAGTNDGTTPQYCVNGETGPSVLAPLTGYAYTVGEPGVSANQACAQAVQANSTFNCAFVVTVIGAVRVTNMLPFLFGDGETISATASGANPFLNFAKIFKYTAIASGAKYANSVWVYPLLLNPASGQPDYSTNPGALPDATTCYNGPDNVACGAGNATSGVTTTVNYVMLANTEYANNEIGANSVFTAENGVQYIGGIVQNPQTPPGITATTPLGVAFESIAGGNQYVNSATPITNPGVYGYSVKSLTTPVVYAPVALNGCIFPYDNLVYHTIGQVYQTVQNGGPSGKSPSYTPLLPWSLTTHWYYSSYLANPSPLSPSEGEILAQSPNNEVIPSVENDRVVINGHDTGANDGNILGTPTFNYNTVTPTKCPPTSVVNGQTYVNVTYQTSTYPTGVNDNCSLFIAASGSPGLPATPQYDGSCFNPATTPGAAFAAASCESYGSNYFTFFWNDMGGAVYDGYNYEADQSSYTTQDGNYVGPQSSGDGTAQLSCQGASHVVLVQ